MKTEQAIRIATRLAEGFPATLRDGNPREYAKACLEALREKQERDAKRKKVGK
jgi:hypothetical protein